MTFGITLGCMPRRAAWLMALAGLLGLASVASANNIRVANVGLTILDTNAGTARVVFNLSWDNSWRGAENWDAAWVFVKFRAPGSSVWEHAILATNSSAHRPAANIAAVSNGRGVFIYSSTNYTGSVSYAQTKLQWQYGSNGYNFAAGAVVEVSVHAIEMVYIPEGAFYLGSGGDELGHFYQYTDGVQTTLPYLVTSETNAITVGTVSGNLYYTTPGGSIGDGLGIISNVFPKGFAAFYCMKYEISQGQYTDFLNKLTATQAGNRYSSLSYSTGYRYTINQVGTNYLVSAPDRACNYLSWADGAAYADWAALRPMTELEFEKACRGTANPQTNEYAWGTNAAVTLNATGCFGTDGSGTETPNPTNANCLVSGGLQGPTRVGIFATTNSTRASSGASYYGVMELSGNVCERPVTVGKPEGRSFMGTLGNGKLSTAGYAENTDWPGKGTDATTADGAGSCGGPWYYGASDARVADRRLAALVDADRTYYYSGGWRAARPAPSGVVP